MSIAQVIAKLALEGENPKALFRNLGPRKFQPRKLTPREQERLGTILAMGPVRKRPGDEKFIELGWVENYDNDPDVVDGNRDFAAFYHSTQGNYGHLGNEFRDLPYSLRGKKIRTYHWPPKMEAENPKRFIRKDAPRWSGLDRANVHSSWGDFTIDNNGGVISFEPSVEGVAAFEMAELRKLKAIVKFNLDEWRRYWVGYQFASSYDILDLGFWTSDGAYMPPEQYWRDEIARQMRIEEPAEPE